MIKRQALYEMQDRLKTITAEAAVSFEIPLTPVKVNAFVVRKQILHISSFY